MAREVKVLDPATLQRRAVEALREVLAALQVTQERLTKQATWDLTLTVGSGKAARRILVECKSVGEPRYLAQAITRLMLATRRLPSAYPVVAAPYIGPQGQRLCKDAGVGYLDLAGEGCVRHLHALRSLSGRPRRCRRCDSRMS